MVYLPIFALLLTTSMNHNTPPGRKPSRWRLYVSTQWRRLFGLNVSKIDDLLFVGGQFTPAEWRELYALGIRAVLSLQAEYEDVFEGPLPQRTLRLLVQDYTAPTIEQLRQAVDFINECRTEKLPVFVHCHAGVGRASLTASAFLISQGYSANDALATIREARPIVYLNRSQHARLLEWEQFLRNSEQNS